MTSKKSSTRQYSYEPIFGPGAMSEYSKVALIICAFVTMREFRPIEPFITSYLTSPPLNLTTEQVNEQIYPVGTYASFGFVIVIFLVTDYLRYTPIIILDGITGILTYALLIGKPDMSLFIVEQFFYGFFYSSDIACNTYLYAKIEDTSLYQKITGYVRASCLVGKFICGVFSQVTISFNFLEKKDLVNISAGAMVIVTLWSFIVPKVDHSIYFHKVERKVIGEATLTENDKQEVLTVVKSQKLSAVAKLLLHDFKVAYTNFYVLKWSLWWSCALCAYFFVATYSQVLWQVLAQQENREDYLLNGAVESISTISSALASYFIALLKINWKAHGDWILTLVSFVLSCLVLFHYFCPSLWLIYVAYVANGIAFHTMLTIAQSEVAQNLERDSYALIFGFNSFVALGLGSILTYTVIEGRVIYLTTRQQFLFYGSYYAVLGGVFAVITVFSYCKSLCKRSIRGVDLENNTATGE